MCSLIFRCFPPYLPGFFEAGLHCIYSAFFVIEAITLGLNLEHKFHGAIQLLLLNLYIILLCLLVLRWHISRHRLGSHLLLSLGSCAITILIGKAILLYLEDMEKTSQARNEEEHVKMQLKMDFIVLFLDVLVYLTITSTYIVFLVRISVQIHDIATVADREYDIDL